MSHRALSICIDVRARGYDSAGPSNHTAAICAGGGGDANTGKNTQEDIGYTIPLHGPAI